MSHKTDKAMELAKRRLEDSLDRFRGADGWCVIGSMDKEKFLRDIENFVVAVIAVENSRGQP